MSKFISTNIPGNGSEFEPQKKDVVFVQRDDDNLYYEYVNISGSDALILLGPDGHIIAKKISDIVQKQTFAEKATTDGIKKMSVPGVFGDPSGIIYLGDANSYTGKTGYLTYYSDPKTIRNSPIPTYITKNGLGIGKGYILGFDNEKPQATLDVLGNVYISGSLKVWDATGSFSGSINHSILADTASYSINSIYATNAGHVYLADWSHFSITASHAKSASLATLSITALTASYFAGEIIVTASVSNSIWSETASLAYLALSSSWADTSSWALTAITASYAKTSSWSIYSLTASYLDDHTTASYAISSSYSITGSYSQTASYALSGQTTTTPFDGNRLIKRSPYTTLNVGGTTVSEFLENFFFPFISATVAISSGGTYYYETGSLQNFSIASVITANDETSFGSSSVKRDGIIWNTTGSITPLSFTFTDTNINSDHSYVTYTQTGNDGTPTIISSNTKTATFVYPYLWGMSATPGLSGNTLYTTFTRQVVAQGSKTVSLIGSVVYIYFCMPSSYTALTHITDPNGFEAYGNFEISSSVPVTSSGLTNNWATTYRVYRTSLLSNPNGTYQFINY